MQRHCERLTQMSQNPAIAVDKLADEAYIDVNVVTHCLVLGNRVIVTELPK